MSENTPLGPASRQIAQRQIGHVWRLSTTQLYVALHREADNDRPEDTDG